MRELTVLEALQNLYKAINDVLVSKTDREILEESLRIVIRRCDQADFFDSLIYNEKIELAVAEVFEKAAKEAESMKNVENTKTTNQKPKKKESK